MSDLPTHDALKEIVGRYWKPDRVLHDDPIGELERKLATATELRARMARAEQAIVSVHERLLALEKAVANG